MLGLFEKYFLPKISLFSRNIIRSSLIPIVALKRVLNDRVFVCRRISNKKPDPSEKIISKKFKFSVL
jgi:hypothetical protein